MLIHSMRGANTKITLHYLSIVVREWLSVLTFIRISSFTGRPKRIGNCLYKGTKIGRVRETFFTVNQVVSDLSFTIEFSRISHRIFIKVLHYPCNRIKISLAVDRLVRNHKEIGRKISIVFAA